MNLVGRIANTNHENKAFGYEMVMNLALGAQKCVLTRMRVPIDIGDHYSREAHGFESSGRGGGMFQNVKTKVFEAAEEEDIKVLKQEKNKDDSLLKLDIP